jgi:hypothetical protein
LFELPTTSTYVASPTNGSVDYNGTDLRFTSSGTPQTIATHYNTLTFLNKTWQGFPINIAYWSPDGGDAKDIPRINSAGTAMEFVPASYELKYQNSGGEINIQNTTTATSLMSGVGSTSTITAGATGTKVVFEATGYIYTTSGTPQASIIFNAGDGSVSTGPVTLPASLNAAQFRLYFKRVSSGTSYRYNWALDIDESGTLKTVGVGSFASTGWGGFTTGPSVTWAWASASTSNRFRVFTAEWEVFRNQ